MTRSSTWTSAPYCTPISAASRPIGPAPTTRTVLGSQKARRPISAMCSHAFTTTVVGSSSTPEHAEALVDPHRVLGLDPPPIGHEPVKLLDSALGVAAVGAHVPLADRAVRAWHRIRSAHDPDHVIADCETRSHPGRSPCRATRGPGSAAPYPEVPTHTARRRSRHPCHTRQPPTLPPAPTRARRPAREHHQAAPSRDCPESRLQPARLDLLTSIRPAVEGLEAAGPALRNPRSLVGCQIRLRSLRRSHQVERM